MLVFVLLGQVPLLLLLGLLGLLYLTWIDLREEPLEPLVKLGGACSCCSRTCSAMRRCASGWRCGGAAAPPPISRACGSAHIG